MGDISASSGAGTLGCVGLAVPDTEALDDLLTQVIDASRIAGRPGAVETRRWVDEGGACLTVIRSGEEVVDLIPGFAGQGGAELADLQRRGPYAVANLREHGETVTRIAVDLPQSPYLPRIPVDFAVAAVTALGVDVTVHADADAFARSEASLIGTSDEQSGGEPPRYAAESLLPYGLFADPGRTDPVAFVSGTVLASETRTTTLTGQSFHAMLLRTVGFTATLCLPASAHPTAPAVGNVVAGACYLVADVPSLWGVQPPPKRRWLRSRTR